MKKLSSALTALVLAAPFSLPVSAAPIFVPVPEQVKTDAAEQVNHRHHRHWRTQRHWNRRYASRSCRYYGRCYPRYYSYRDYHRYHRRPGVTIYFNF